MTRAALVVGINTYTHFRALKAPAQDAEAIAQLLQQDGDFKVTRLPEAITKENDRLSPRVGETLAVSQGQLERALEQLFCPDSDQVPDTALFYFSGHGLPDSKGFDKGYLVTSETDGDRPRLAISLRWLHWLLSKSPVRRQIVWLDCCHSGGLLIDVEAANPGNHQGYSRCFIASSRDFEKSWQDLNSDYSVLTKALLEGLDPARLPGRGVDSFALVDYVNQALKGELQTPICTNFGDAISLTRTWQDSAEPVREEGGGRGVCPYKGLEFFEFNDEDPQYFFGREALTDDLLDRARTADFMALVGASGNGKSSVLRAGLLHQLKVGRRIAGSDRWQILMMRPDDRPMKNLAAVFVPEEVSQLNRAEALGRAEALLREGGAGLARLVEAAIAPRVLLVVDQFEEVFTRCGELAERERFFDCLMGALGESDRLGVVIAMRSDFVGKCLERDYSGLARRVQDSMVSVLPLEPEGLRAAICEPARRVGLTVEDALVTEILQDIQGAPGSLPLLQYALKELWKRRRKSELVLSAYQELGGITGTLDRRATELYSSFDEAQQRTARHIFQQLTQLGEGTEDTRRRVFLENLIAEPLHPAAQVKTIVDRLVDRDNRLLVTSEVVGKGEKEGRRAIVDVAHEALIRHWKLLRQWIEQDRDLLRQQRRIEGSAVTWQNNQQNYRYLLEGWALKEAIRFQKQQANTFPLSDVAKEFIAKSQGHRRWKQVKTASWLIIPAIAIVGIVEYNIREQQVRSDIGRIDNTHGGSAEKYAVEDLVRGCVRGVPRPEQNWLGNYIGERILFGNCRSLRRLDLSGANLIGTNLSNANLSNATLRGASLYDANLIGTNLKDANLVGANLNDTNLSGANLSGAILFNTSLPGVNLSNASLFKTILDGANLSDANLVGADFSDASLFGASLFGADLTGANLSNANLTGANLSNANLSAANLSNVNLSDAILVTSDLRNTPLTPQQLFGEDKPYLCGVALPEILTDAGIKPNRDCAELLKLLEERDLMPPEQVPKFVEDAREKEWD